mmetsp:Transcript_64599/g.154144  ORF Transcript_64599/g.154144 Transcript_64599/m.154144 type:complete len:291 (-) Transcript_64599:236-1108(-)
MALTSGPRPPSSTILRWAMALRARFASAATASTLVSVSAQSASMERSGVRAPAYTICASFSSWQNATFASARATWSCMSASTTTASATSSGIAPASDSCPWISSTNARFAIATTAHRCTSKLGDASRLRREGSAPTRTMRVRCSTAMERSANARAAWYRSSMSADPAHTISSSRSFTDPFRAVVAPSSGPAREGGRFSGSSLMLGPRGMNISRVLSMSPSLASRTEEIISESSIGNISTNFFTFCAVSSPSAAPFCFLSLEKIENTLRMFPLMVAPILLPQPPPTKRSAR